MTIETFKGERPLCRHCGEPLKPNYRTEKEGFQEGTGRKRIYKDYYAAEVYAIDEQTPRDEKGRAYQDTYAFGRLYYDEKRQTWYTVEKYSKILERKFLGHFGVRGNGFFCTTECAYLWAVRLLREQAKDPNP